MSSSTSTLRLFEGGLLLSLRLPGCKSPLDAQANGLRFATVVTVLSSVLHCTAVGLHMGRACWATDEDSDTSEHLSKFISIGEGLSTCTAVPNVRVSLGIFTHKGLGGRPRLPLKTDIILSERVV